MSKDLFLARYGSKEHVDTIMKNKPNDEILDAIVENPFSDESHVQKIFNDNGHRRIYSHVIRSLLNRPTQPKGLHEYIAKNAYDGNIFKKAVETANKDELDSMARHTSYKGVLLDKIAEHPLADSTTYHNLMMNKHRHIVAHFMGDDKITAEHLETVYHNQPDHGLQGFAVSNEKAPASILKHAAENHPVEYIRTIAMEHPNYPHPK